MTRGALSDVSEKPAEGRALVLDAAAAALADGIGAELGGGLARVALDAEGRELRGAAPAGAGGEACHPGLTALAFPLHPTSPSRAVPSRVPWICDVRGEHRP